MFKKLRSWHLVPSLHANRRGKMETVIDFLFLGSKITADRDYSHEIRRQLLHGRKGITNLDSVFKSRDITQLTKVKANIHWKDWCSSWSSKTLATWCEDLTHWKKPLMLGKIEGRSKKGHQRMDGWMASPMQWTWTWVNFRRWWGTGRLVFCSPWACRVWHD